MPDSSIQVWTLDDATGAIAAEVVPTFAVRERRCGQWTVRWDAGLEAKMHALRSEALPAETGGILVGVIDQKLMTITVVDAGAAPADSDGDEQSFVRGTEGGRAFVEKCARLTGGMVGYVGEWHSHPKDRDASPSSTDLVLLATLTMRLEADGIPALMVIVSEGEVGVSLGTTKPCTAT